MVRGRWRGAVLAGVFTCLSGAASAQVSALDLIGGLIGAAQMQAARDAWTRLPRDERDCLQKALATRNADLESAIRSGMAPDDGRLAPFVSQCRRLAGTNLRRGASCTVRDGNGSQTNSTCDQSFAVRDGSGDVRPVDPREAAELHFSGTRVFITEVENEEARQARFARAEAQERVEQLRLVRAALGNFQSQPSPVVRAEVARLQGRIDQQLAARGGPSAPDTEAIDREVKALDTLSSAEASRLAALDRLSGLRAQAEARTTSNTSDGLKSRLAELRSVTAAVSELPRPIQVQKATPAADRELGPSFDCEKAVTPLPILICENAGLRQLDLEMARPFYLLRHLQPDEASALKAESNELVKRTLESCRIPETGKVNGALRARAVPCIVSAYQRQKDAWAARVGRDGGPSARQELARPIKEHVRLQDALRTAGLLPGGAVADGVYGGITRRAVVALAEAENLPSDGFLSNTLADRLRQRTGPASGPSTLPDTGLVTRINAVASRYESYLADHGVEEREWTARMRAQALVEERRRRALALLDGSVSDDLRAELTAVLRQADVQDVTDQRAHADGLVQRMAQLEPRLREAETVQRATTDRNRFLIEDDPQDILLLYNTSPKAAGVARGLDGGLVFDTERMIACTLLDPPADRITQEGLASKARALGAPVKDTLPRCSSAQQQTADLIVFVRSALRAQPGLFTTIASAVDTGVYAFAGTVLRTDIEAARQAEAVRAAEAEAEVARGVSEGLVILAPANGSRTLCRIAGGEAVMHERLLKPYEALLRGELRGPPTIVPSSADGAFLSAKRGQCGAIYASAREMAVLSRALTRDAITYRYLPVWIPPGAVEKARQDLAAADEQARREVTELEQARRQDQERKDRTAIVDRLQRSRNEADTALKGGVPPDLQAFLARFVAEVTAVGPDTTEDRLKELGDRYARRRPQIDEAARLSRALTPKSRFLIEGERGDLIILYNDSGKAPSIVRNLRGELVFEDGRGAACVYHAPLADVFLNRQIRDRSAALGARLALPLSTCVPGALPDQDLIFAERDRLLREPVDQVVALAEAVNGGLYTRLTVMDAAALASSRQAEAAKANEIEAGVRGGKADGFGLIAASIASNVVCRVGDAGSEAHDAILARLSDRIGDELPSSPIIAPTTADGAFIGAKRGECGAVYASAADLRALVDAMGRDGLPYRFLPIWTTSEEIARTQAAIDADKLKRIQDQADRDRELRDREATERDRQQEAGLKREALERALRAQWGERARFFEQELGEEAKAFADGRKSTFTAHYPKLAQVYATLRDDRWEFMSAETTIRDYGTATYKDRTLETGLASTTIKMRNRIRGEYRDVCFVTGYVRDAEFGMVRDVFGEVCDGVDPKLAQYRQDERFVSRWIAP